MSPVLIAVIVILAIVIGTLIWAWLFNTPKSAGFQTYAAETLKSSRRNKAWDAAVARARNRHF